MTLWEFVVAGFILLIAGFVTNGSDLGSSGHSKGRDAALLVLVAILADVLLAGLTALGLM